MRKVSSLTYMDILRWQNSRSLIKCAKKDAKATKETS